MRKQVTWSSEVRPRRGGSYVAPGFSFEQQLRQRDQPLPADLVGEVLQFSARLLRYLQPMAGDEDRIAILHQGRCDVGLAHNVGAKLARLYRAQMHALLDPFRLEHRHDGVGSCKHDVGAFDRQLRRFP